MSKKLVYYKKLGIVYNLVVQGFNEDCEADIDLLLNLIQSISYTRNLFVEFYNSVCSVNKEAILFSFDFPKENFFMNRTKLQIDPNKLNNIKDLFKNRVTIFYVFDPKVKWDYFLNNAEEVTLFEENKLLSQISLSDNDGIFIAISEVYIGQLEYILEQFSSRGYKIKKQLF